MKKIIILFIILIVIFLSSRIYVSNKNNKYKSNLEKEITENYKLDEKIKYLNKTDLYYIILTTDKLIVLDNHYNELFTEDSPKLYKLDKDSELVYRLNQPMYEIKKVSKDKIVYKYYNIYTGELLDTVTIGGTNG